MNDEAYNTNGTAEKISSQSVDNQPQSQQFQIVLEKHSQELIDLRAAITLAQQQFDDHSLKAELRYNEITGWYSELKQTRQKLEELSRLTADQTENSSQRELKTLQDEYQKLQKWSQELNERLQKIQSHWLYSILSRFIR